ncbi:cyclin-dependent protein kinase inhibitor SMR14 [Euphorbia lathyris]|uniref:cyclin-dependent protein kinase inhibitor SMR14 n=1 Tax=Euphorbia lathyris TaxID=212925 RepID=UPI003313AD75
MYSKLKSFSVMGMSNSEILISGNDLEFKFLVRPPLQFEDDDEHCELSPSEDSDGIDEQKQEQAVQEQEQEKHELQQQQQKGGEKCKLLVSSLKIKLPSSSLEEEFKINQEEDVDDKSEDGLKTPTSMEKRIPLVLSCPPAPRKPKSMPCNKRKLLGGRRRVLLDLSNEIESLFPPSVVVGAKIKKVRPEI